MQLRTNAIQLLLQADFGKEAVVLEWIKLRGAMFGWLEYCEVSYAGTRDALVSAMAALEPYGVAADLAFIYHVATLAEWDEQFEMTKGQVEIVRDACERVSGVFRNASGRMNP